MSEHMSIKGSVDYWHLPYDEQGGLTYCNHCKETCDKVSIELHNGIASDWMNVVCGKCNKSIWTAKVKTRQTKNDKKCAICKKPTNWIDSSVSGGTGKKMEYWCSPKCYKKHEKEERNSSESRTGDGNK